MHIHQLECIQLVALVCFWFYVFGAFFIILFRSRPLVGVTQLNIYYMKWANKQIISSLLLDFMTFWQFLCAVGLSDRLSGGDDVSSSTFAIAKPSWNEYFCPWRFLFLFTLSVLYAFFVSFLVRSKQRKFWLPTFQNFIEVLRNFVEHKDYFDFC